MANTFTDLYPHIFTALNVVSRERVGFIPSVSRDAKADQAAIGQQVIASVVPAMTASDTSSAAIPPEGQDRDVDNIPVQITKSRKVDFNLTGEEQKGLGEFNNMTIEAQTFAQAFRTLSNEIEADIANLYTNASRAYGTAGTTPFGTGDDLTDLTRAMALLDDNGAPVSDRHCVLNSTAGATLLGKQPALFKVNEAGSELARQQARFQQMFGAEIGISAQVKYHTKGTGTGYQTSAAEPVGETGLALDTGSGTVLAGDVVTLAGDTNKYVVGTELTGGVATINKPGLIESAADNTALTVGNSFTANMAFSRDAILLATRTPALPSRGDAASDRTYVTDPISGLTFEIAYYPQFREGTFFVGIAWGVKAVKPEHMALLLG